jgi:predicted nucleotidyltransferase
MSQEYADMKLSEAQSRVQKIAQETPEIVLIYLFGSQASGTAGPLSDYDLAVLLTRDHETPEAQARLTHDLAAVLDADRLDVVYLHRAPVELAFAAISEGRLFYERSLAERVEYEALIMSRYADYLPVLRRQWAEILEDSLHDRRIQRYHEALGRTERTLGEIRAAQGQKQR